MIDVPTNKQITITVNSLSGGPILLYKWKIDDTLQSNDTNTLTVLPYTLQVGGHTVKFKEQNYCGNWSSEISETINIIEVMNMVTTTLTATINQPNQTINTVLNLTSLVTVNVLDQLGQPVGSASVTVGTNPIVTTNLSGVATVPDVLYGEQVITATK